MAPRTQSGLPTAATATNRLKEMEAKLKESEKKAAALEKQLSIAGKGSNKAVKTMKKKNMSTEESQWVNQLKKALKYSVWGTCIFCNSDERLYMVCKCIMLDMNIKNLTSITDEEAKKEAQSNWIADNSEVILSLFNEQRNYAQSQVRIVVHDLLEKGVEEDIPTLDIVMKCACRDQKYLETPEGTKFFDFYWDVLLKRVAGKEHWSDRIRLQETICGAMHPKSPGHAVVFPCISPSLEAFLVLVFANCFKKWKKVEDLKKKAVANGKVPDPYDPKADYAQCPYTDHLDGKNKYGGWNQAGRTEFRRIRELIKQGRAQDFVEDYEKATLLRLRYVVYVNFLMVYVNDSHSPHPCFLLGLLMV